MLAGTSEAQYTQTGLLLAATEYPSLGLQVGFFFSPANDSLGISSDENGNLYEVTDDPAVVFVNALTGKTHTLVSLPFVPGAIAVDFNNNHVFVADLYHNAIAVYSLTGQLVATLH